MGVPGSANPMLLAGGAAAYEIDQSLRFNPADSARLYRTLAASQTRTYSFWYKYANLSGGNMYLFHHKNSGDTNYLGVRSGGSPSENQWQTLNQGSSFTEIASSRKYRDPSAWQHVVWKCTSTNVTMYVNGVEFASAGGANTSLSGGTLEIGARGSAEYFGGYIAEFHFVDGTAYNPSDFGETDLTTGAWIPKRFGGTYGANGVYLKFDPAATNGIGHDHSGNGNNFTATGFSTSGTGTDVMSDTPTTNYPTGNPLASNNPSSVSEGNLKFVGDTANIAANGMHTTMGMSSGKWYFEVDINVAGGARTVGILPADAFAKSGKTTTTNYDTYYNNGALSYTGFSGDKIEGFGTSITQTSYGNSWTTNDVIGVAFDADNGKLFFAKNNTWQNSGDPVAGTNAAFTGISGTYVAHSGGSQGFTATFNFGQRAFAYTPPTGYKALNTQNLPEPTIKDGGKHFNTVLYTGNGSTQSITGVGFQPDFTWIKKRASTGNHMLTDVVRGPNTEINSNTTAAETANTNALTSFDTDGFSVGADGAVNINSEGLVAWNWKGGGTGSTNTAGSITSTVSANPSAGFSIVTYTGNATSNQTVGHGLGVAPSLVIVKNRDRISSWLVRHSSLPANQTPLLENTIGYITTNYWESTYPSSTVFTISSNNEVNANGEDLVAYCFSEVAGYSKFGSYTGNGSSDGPFVYTGMRVNYLMVKRTDSTGDWFILDGVRETYNYVSRQLGANNSGAESGPDVYNIDFTSNGFKLRNSVAGFNASGGTYIFIAYAENPFKYANAR